MFWKYFHHHILFVFIEALVIL